MIVVLLRHQQLDEGGDVRGGLVQGGGQGDVGGLFGVVPLHGEIPGAIHDPETGWGTGKLKAQFEGAGVGSVDPDLEVRAAAFPNHRADLGGGGAGGTIFDDAVGVLIDDGGGVGKEAGGIGAGGIRVDAGGPVDDGVDGVSANGCWITPLGGTDSYHTGQMNCVMHMRTMIIILSIPSPTHLTEHHARCNYTAYSRVTQLRAKRIQVREPVHKSVGSEDINRAVL